MVRTSEDMCFSSPNSTGNGGQRAVLKYLALRSWRRCCYVLLEIFGRALKFGNWTVPGFWIGYKEVMATIRLHPTHWNCNPSSQLELSPASEQIPSECVILTWTGGGEFKQLSLLALVTLTSSHLYARVCRRKSAANSVVKPLKLFCSR